MPESDRSVRRVFLIGGASAVAAIVLIVVIATQGSRSPTPQPNATERQTIGIGGIGLLSKGDGDIVPLGVTKLDFDQMTKTLLAKDDVGWRELIGSGRVIGTPDGTRARVVDRGMYWRQVRLLDGPFKDRSGYVPMEWVRPEQ